MSTWHGPDNKKTTESGILRVYNLVKATRALRLQRVLFKSAIILAITLIIQKPVYEIKRLLTPFISGSIFQ